MQDVFVYGSLTAAPGARPARLAGWRRTWGVAMDNRVAIPGYKVYTDPASGERPAVHVAFLDIEPSPGAAVDGALLAVADLAALDARERNYERVRVEVAGRPAWTYVGRPDARERARRPPVVVQRAYLELAGAAEPPPFPVVDLDRVDL